MPKNLPRMQSMPSLSKLFTKPAATAKKVADSGQSDTKTTSRLAADIVEPTISNLSQPQRNPAANAAKDTSQKAPIIHQVSAAVIPSTNNTKANDQSYMSKASSYSPNMPTMPSFVSTTAKKRDMKSKPPAPTRSTSDVKKQLPKLDGVPSGNKSPAPKLP